MYAHEIKLLHASLIHACTVASKITTFLVALMIQIKCCGITSRTAHADLVPVPNRRTSGSDQLTLRQFLFDTVTKSAPIHKIRRTPASTPVPRPDKAPRAPGAEQVFVPIENQRRAGTN